MIGNTEASNAHLRARLMELHQSFITQSVDTNRDRRVRNASESIAWLAQSLKEFESELQALPTADRHAIEAAFRSEMGTLLLQFRMEAARLYFTG